MLAEWMSWMADAFLRTPGQTSAHHMPAAPPDQPLNPSEANSVSIPEAFEGSEDSEGNTCRDGMPVLHRSKCSLETAWDYLENASHSTHTRHSSGELRIEVHYERRTHTCLQLRMARSPDS